MPELIDRKAVLEIALCYCPDDDGCCSKVGNDLREMLDEIEALPTIEPEMRHGQWIMLEPYGTHHTHLRKCSECGEIKAQELTNFCPNCGAKMLNENN